MKIMPLVYLITICAWFTPLPAEQTYQPQAADFLQQAWRWKALEKLDHLNVVSMCEAPNGDIWFGNDGSVAKYDGQQLEIFNVDPDLISKIQDNRVSPLCKNISVRKDNTILCEVFGNLVSFDGENWSLIYRKTADQSGVKKIIVAQDGSIWLLNAHSLLKYDRELKKPALCHKIPQNTNLITLCKDREENLWLIQDEKKPSLIKIPTFDGLPVAENQWKHYPLPVPKASVSAELAITKQQQLIYVDRLDHVQVQKFDPLKESWEVAFDTQLRRHHALHIDSGNTIWLGSQESIYRYSDGNGKLYLDETWIPQTIIEELLFDQKQRLWIRDRSNRIYTADLSDRKWHTFEDLHFHCQSEDGTRWFTNHQSYIISEKNGQYTQHDLKIGNAGKIYASSHELIWALGSTQAQADLFIYKHKKWERIQELELASFSTGSFFEANDKSIWMAASEKNSSDKTGLLQWKVTPELDIVLTKHVKELVPRIYQCVMTDDGLIWLGGFALYCYNPSQDRLERVDKLPYRKISAMALTPDGALWVAQTGTGLYKYDQREWSHYSIKNGLPSNTLVELLTLDNGHLLAASKNGISRFDGITWTPQVYPQDMYLVYDGGDLRQDQTGSVWVNMTEKEMPNPGKLGKSAFFTHQIKRDENQPETRLNYYSSKIAHKSSGLISWTGHDHGLSSENDPLFFSWQLNDGPWSAFSPKKEQAFLDLNEGQYSFEVRARDIDFNIDPTPAKVTFTVLAPIWKQGWFISMIVTFMVIISSLILTIIKARERHLLQQQHQREQHWAELDQVKTIFFSNITHELRTPLTVVLSRLESLLSNEKNEHKKNLMSVMLRNVNRISILISQLLDFKKVEERNLQLEASEGDIGRFIKDVVDRSLPFAEDHHCQITCEGNCLGWFDPDKLDKIITNLISNAVKYSPEGGQIKIVFEQQGDANHPLLHLQVEDQGCGMSAEQLKHIFDRFYRVPQTSTTQGVGIGLNLTKELVDVWGGEISAQSPVHNHSKQHGTRITVRLPISKSTEVLADDQPISEQSNSPSPEGLPHLLIVEDDAEIRAALQDELKNQYQIRLAENGRVGIEKARDIMPDLIITDLMMPDMDGLQLCQTLKTDQLTSHIPIIMLTAKASLDSELEGLEKGADDYITKPFHIAHVKKRIENILDQVKRLKEKYSRHYMLPDQPLPEDTMDREFLEKVFQILENEVKDVHFDADELARKLHMSLSTLRRKLKAVTDDTPAKLIRDMRLKMGAALLIKSELNVTQIALEVGFAESNHFARLFKAFYDQTPTQYRSNHVKIEEHPIS